MSSEKLETVESTRISEIDTDIEQELISPPSDDYSWPVSTKNANQPYRDEREWNHDTHDLAHIYYTDEATAYDIAVVKDALDVASNIASQYITMPSNVAFELYLLPCDDVDNPNIQQAMYQFEDEDKGTLEYAAIELSVPSAMPFSGDDATTQDREYIEGYFAHGIIHEFLEMFLALLTIHARGSYTDVIGWFTDGVVELLYTMFIPSPFKDQYFGRINQRAMVLSSNGFVADEFDALEMMPYDGAPLFVMYLLDKFGPSTVMDVMISEHSFDEALVDVTGVDEMLDLVYGFDTWLQFEMNYCINQYLLLVE